MRVLKRRPRTVGAVFVSAVATALFVLPASPANAAPTTFDNVCQNSAVPTDFSQIGLTLDGTSPASVGPGDSVTLSNLSATGNIPGGIFVAGYNLGFLVEGPNNIPVNTRLKIEGTNTVEGVQNTNLAGGGTNPPTVSTPPDGSITVSTTINDPDDLPGNGDETATDAALNASFTDQTWTAGASGTIEFRQQSATAFGVNDGGLLINAFIGGFFNVQFRCWPGQLVPPPDPPADPNTPQFQDPAPTFSSTEIVPPQQSAISIDDQTVAEGGAATFNVTLDQASADEVTVDFATSDGSANAPDDYTSNTGTVTFAAGDTSETVTVQTNQDALDENDETFNVDLSNATGATIADNQGVGTISDDDPEPAISIDDQTVAEGGTASFTVSLDAASGRQVTVDYDTSDGTANAPADYLGNSGTVTFAPGDTSETVAVNTNQDPFDENDETFNVDLSNASNATIADNQGVGTITDDDEPPAISIDDQTVTEGGTASFTVSLDAASGKQVSVDFATSDGTATAPGDYTSNTGTVTFAPGDTSEPVTVQTIDDNEFEGATPETFNVDLSNATNATIADNQGVGTINDNDAAPPVADGSMDVIVNGPTSTRAGDKTVVAKVSNDGTGPLTVCDTDITWDIEASDVDTTGPVEALNPGCKTLNPGGSTRFRFRWTFGTGEVSAGVIVDYTASVAVADDATPGNNTDTETRTAK